MKVKDDLFSGNRCIKMHDDLPFYSFRRAVGNACLPYAFCGAKHHPSDLFRM